MSKFLFTVILLIRLILPLCVYGQNIIAKNEYEAKHTEKIESPNAIFFAPLNLVDFFINPNIQIGYERFISNKWTLQIEGGVIINTNYVVDWVRGIKISECPYTNKGFRVKGSIKSILIDKRNFKFYVSPEFFYSRNKSGIAREFYVSDPDFEYSLDAIKWSEEYPNVYMQMFYNDEEKMGLNFKVGCKLHFGNHFFIEPHLGLGLAYRNSIQTGRENSNDELFDFLGIWRIFDIARPNKWVPTLPFNVKVGVRF